MEIENLFILTVLVGSQMCVAAVDNIDGKLLADELRIIKREIGVNVLQVLIHTISYKNAYISYVIGPFGNSHFYNTVLRVLFVSLMSDR